MKDIFYAIIFCIITFFMWLSIVFSIAEKKYGSEKLFESGRTTLITYGISSAIALIFTFFTYLIVWYVQSIF